MITLHRILKPFSLASSLACLLVSPWHLDAQQPAFLTDGLVAYYPFNGSIKDATGNGNDGVAYGGVTSAPDRFGSDNSAELFDGATGYITIPRLSTFQYSDVTYSLWVYVNQLPPIAAANGSPDGFHETTIVGRDRSGDNAIGTLAIISENGITLTNVVEYYTGSDGVVGPPCRQGHWFHLVSTISQSNQVVIYVNGIAEANQMLISAGASVTDFNLGYSAAPLFAWSPRYHFNGILDDVRIYNRALSAAEVAALYQYESTPPGPTVTLIQAVKPSFSNLTVGTSYQLQSSTDLQHWTNQGLPFTATAASMIYPQYWDVNNWGQLYFRVLQSP